MRGCVGTRSGTPGGAGVPTVPQLPCSQGRTGGGTPSRRAAVVLGGVAAGLIRIGYSEIDILDPGGLARRGQ